jgi:hypothetical protein
MNSVLAKSHSLNIIYTGRQENHTCLFCEAIHLIDFISFLFVPVYPNVKTNFAHNFFLPRDCKPRPQAASARIFLSVG